jgi:hypothetical protein
VAECAQPVEIQAAAEPSARVGFEPGDLIGDECHVGRLVDADLGASLEHGVGRSGLRAERARHGRRVHRNHPAVLEHRDRRLVRVVHADDHVAVACQFLGEGGEQERGEAAG